MTATSVILVRVFDYLDFRLFLRDWYRQEKAAKRVSLRTFSRAAGFTSPNYFKLVMDGDRNLSDESAEKFAKALRLTKQETEFFKNLVCFTQARTHAEKDASYQGLLAAKPFQARQPIRKEQYAYYSAWYHPVVRELVTSDDFDGSLADLARRIRPAVTVTQVEKSVALLEKLGFIARAGDGRWLASSATVTTGPESDSLALTKYHQNLLDVAKRVIADVPPEERDVSALTLGVRRELLPELKRRIQNFRKEILDLVAGETKSEDVVLLAVQLMPVTLEEEGVYA